MAVDSEAPRRDDSFLRVLLVEDVALEARLIEELLLQIRARCYVVEWVQTFEEATERLGQGEHDVCLCDWHVGWQTGATLLRAVRAQDLDVPVVVLSSMPLVGIDEEALALGASTCLDKACLNAETLDRAVRFAAARGEAESSLRARAHTDALTGLCRREHFVRQVNRALEEVRRGARWEAAVVYIDLDRFKEVNDALGHHAGDRVLRAVSQRMKRAFRPRDLLARVGGDEFCVLVQGRDAGGGARAAAARLKETLQVPLLVDGLEVEVGASVGLAHSTDGTETVHDLMVAADKQMFDDKDRGRRQRRRTFPVEGPDGLIRALETGQFRLVYAPVLDVASARVVALEARVRWEHPERGELLGSEFLDVADEMGFTRLLGEWMLAAAAGDWQDWTAVCGAACPALRLPLSQDQLRDDLLADAVDETLELTGIAPAQLTLVIGPGALAGDRGVVDQRMASLRAIGVRVCLDGSGEQGLDLDAVLDLAVDELRVPPELARDLEASPRRAVVVHGLFRLLEQVGVTLTARDVATATEASLLEELGCAHQQGRHHGRARTPSQVLSLLEGRVRRLA